MSRLRGLDEGTAAFRSQGIQADGNDLHALRIEFISQFPPHGQITGAASVRCPGVNDDFLTGETGKMEDVAVEIGQF